MKFVEAQQGTEAWHLSRCGKITASCFRDAISRIGGLDERQAKYVQLVRDGMSPANAVREAGYKAIPTAESIKRAIEGEDPSEPSDVAKRYAADLAIERISGQPHGEPAKAWVLERGHEMEARARMLYEARTGAFITESGICLSDDGIFGYSSDGLSDDDGLIEIKAPIDSMKIMEMLRTGDTSEYDHQIQGGLWLTGRKWLDFIMYVPDLAAVGKDLYVKRIYRDDAFIDKMVLQLVEFDRLVTDYTIILRADTMPITTIEESMQNDIAPEPAPQADSTAIADAMIAEVQATLISPTEELALARALPDGAELSPGAQALHEQEGVTNFAAHHRNLAATVTPPTLRLGQISERLGFTVTADFLASLGFKHSATDKAAKLFHESEFHGICAALQRHIASVQAEFQKETA